MTDSRQKYMNAFISVFFFLILWLSTLVLGSESKILHSAVRVAEFLEGSTNCDVAEENLIILGDEQNKQNLNRWYHHTRRK
jgi:hypothetical protein